MHILDFLSVEPSGQSAVQIGELTLALILSSLIGLEREFRAKSAGLRTHTLVGVAAALIMLVSKYGFGDIIVKYAIVLDPSRVAAQIVSGIGFIGGGLIFVAARRRSWSHHGGNHLADGSRRYGVRRRAPIVGAVRDRGAISGGLWLHGHRSPDSV
jgi:hypothetical protein